MFSHMLNLCYVENGEKKKWKCENYSVVFNHVKRKMYFNLK